MSVLSDTCVLVHLSSRTTKTFTTKKMIFTQQNSVVIPI